MSSYEHGMPADKGSIAHRLPSTVGACAEELLWIRLDMQIRLFAERNSFHSGGHNNA